MPPHRRPFHSRPDHRREPEGFDLDYDQEITGPPIGHRDPNEARIAKVEAAIEHQREKEIEELRERLEAYEASKREAAAKRRSDRRELAKAIFLLLLGFLLGELQNRIRTGQW